MKNDARLLLNKKKWNNQSGNRGNSQTQRGVAKPVVDARKILNSKRAKQNPPSNRFAQGNRNNSNKPVRELFTKAFLAASKVTQRSNVFRGPISTAPQEKDKRIKVTNNGNILITSKNDAKIVTQSFQRGTSFRGNMPTATLKVQKPVHQWVPADVDMDDLEHTNISDIFDMESLPQAPQTQFVNMPFQQPMMVSRMMSDRLSGMQNTMIADQMASTSTLQPQAKIIVSNLHPSVTKQDILDLFGVVGLVKALHMNQPGSAIVEFFEPLDATKACSLYHNRLLDGQTMKCYLETGMNTPRTSVSQRLGGRIETPSPIKTLASNPRSRYNPRDVRFTVQLT